MLVMKKPFGFRQIRWLPMSAMSLINMSVPWAVISISETRLSSSMASVLNATTPLWTLIVGMLLFRTVTHKLQWLGMAISTIGLLVLLEINASSIVSVDLIGFGCMIAATFCYGLGTQLSKRVSTGLSMYQITFVSLLVSTIGCGAVAFAAEPAATLSHLTSLKPLSAIVGLGVFGTGLAYILFYYLVQKGTPEFASMVTYLVPASAIVWGATLLGEEIRWSLIAGLVFILGGVYLASRKPKQKPVLAERMTETTSIVD
jgi:drug/metabolite transporter (DMT)-like permease